MMKQSIRCQREAKKNLSYIRYLLRLIYFFHDDSPWQALWCIAAAKGEGAFNISISIKQLLHLGKLQTEGDFYWNFQTFLPKNYGYLLAEPTGLIVKLRGIITLQIQNFSFSKLEDNGTSYMRSGCVFYGVFRNNHAHHIQQQNTKVMYEIFTELTMKFLRR